MNNTTNSHIKICHLTTVHVRYDTRIYIKECSSLARMGYEVILLVADGKDNEYRDGIHIYDIGKPKSRLKRFLFSGKIMLRKALALKADIYHFHDPELLRIGKKLVRKGKKVIYDSHEDVPRQVLDKAYIPSTLRKPLSRLLERYEDSVVRKLSGVVTVTPNLERRFSKNNPNVVQIRNFPKIEEFQAVNLPRIEKENAVCYVGAISKVRGILSMVSALAFNTSTKLLLGGKFENRELRIQAITTSGWENVCELGFLNREEVKNTLFRSVAGLVVLEPTKSYLDSIPVKMFEYMIAGIPIIASDFSYWRELIAGVDCALFVDPQDPEQISIAIKKLVNNKEMAHEMGRRGQRAVFEEFNWNIEEKKLLDFYKKLLD